MSLAQRACGKAKTKTCHARGVLILHGSMLASAQSRSALAQALMAAHGKKAGTSLV